jgi:hypothetical protein
MSGYGATYFVWNVKGVLWDTEKYMYIALMVFFDNSLWWQNIQVLKSSKISFTSSNEMKIHIFTDIFFLWSRFSFTSCPHDMIFFPALALKSAYCYTNVCSQHYKRYRDVGIVANYAMIYSVETFYNLQVYCFKVMAHRNIIYIQLFTKFVKSGSS